MSNQKSQRKAGAKQMKTEISLRDYFAAQALPQAIEDYHRRALDGALGERVLPYENKLRRREEIIAAQAYKYADTMLAERGKINPCDTEWDAAIEAAAQRIEMSEYRGNGVVWPYSPNDTTREYKALAALIRDLKH